MAVTIRKAERDDLDAISEFAATVVPEHYTPILGERAAHEQLAWWTQERMTPAVEAGQVLVATTDSGQVVGVCQTGELDGDQVIWKLYLAQDHRRRSLGAELLQHAIRSLPEHADHVDVEHFAGNTGAARFYEREGFEVIRTAAPADLPASHAIVWRRLRFA